MDRSKVAIASVAVVLLAIAIVYYVISPFVFLHTLAFDVRKRNQTALAADIDFPSVREGLDDQLDALLEVRAEHRVAPTQSGSEKALQVFPPSLGQQVINNIVTPAGVAVLLRERVEPARDGTGRPSLWQGRLSWLSPNRVRVTYESAHHPDWPLSIELERQRIFSWRLTRLNIPPKMLAGLNR